MVIKNDLKPLPNSSSQLEISKKCSPSKNWVPNIGILIGNNTQSATLKKILLILSFDWLGTTEEDEIKRGRYHVIENLTRL